MNAIPRALALGSVFASAFLLFLLEPMVGKMLLPDFGGSPAVWGTCLMFFQGLLLLGYGYGHLVSGLPPRIAVRAHVAALLLPLAVLPFAVSGARAPAPGAWPVPALLAALFATAALPFFALSTNTSLVQDWYARRRGVEPYFLYAASNAGSLSALLAYPFVVDAFSGDAVPAHLLTVEAIRLYLARLKPGGLLLLHVSNRYLTLVPLLQGAAREIGITGAVIDYVPPDEALAPSGDQRQHWSAANVVVALARDSGRLAPLLAADWTPLDQQPHTPIVWTDDRSSLLDVLN